MCNRSIIERYTLCRYTDRYTDIHGNRVNRVAQRLFQSLYNTGVHKHRVLLLVLVPAVLLQIKQFSRNDKEIYKVLCISKFQDELENHRNGRFNREKFVFA